MGRQEMPHGEEEEVRIGPPRCDDQAGSPEDSHPQDQGWQQEVQGPKAGHWQLRVRPGSSTLSTMLATTSLSGPRPSSRTPSLSSTPPPSVSGMSPTTLNLLPERREPS